MAKRRRKELRDMDKILTLQEGARARYVYFICKSDDPNEPGYWWQLVGPDDMVVTENPDGSFRLFSDRAACLKSLRANQKHGSSPHIRDIE
jgi:hypothetical protein